LKLSGEEFVELEQFQNKLVNPSKAGRALESHLGELRQVVAAIPPEDLALHSGSGYAETGSGEGEFLLSLWDSEFRIFHPSCNVLDLNGNRPPVFVQSLLMYYFVTATGTALTGTWVSFGDLPDGRIYAQAFQGYTGDTLAKAFNLNLFAFRKSCELAGGQSIGLADAAYRFQAFPRLPVAVTYWLGDDGFPSTCKILFDSSACSYLPIDGCAILGSMLTKRIVHAL
jgi:hypothetical protein